MPQGGRSELGRCDHHTVDDRRVDLVAAQVGSDDQGLAVAVDNPEHPTAPFDLGAGRPAGLPEGPDRLGLSTGSTATGECRLLPLPQRGSS